VSTGPFIAVATDEAIELAARCLLADTYGPLIELDREIDAALLGAEPVIALGADLLVDEPGAPLDAASALSMVTATITRAPLAGIAACTLLRVTSTLARDARFLFESTTYSMLQTGPEFAAWRAQRPAREVSHSSEAPVHASRTADTLTIALNRPTHGNAVNPALRDALCEALTVAMVDRSIERIALAGNGPHFCTGGDLDTFGTFVSPADAHTGRLARSPARMLAAVRDRLHVTMHGNCMGSGVELAAFGSTVVAHPDTTFSLPEIGLGLIPGAGGTVSIVDRIGPRRTAWLLLTGQRIDASKALEWGLIDQITNDI
jgi:hypothetical protein